MTAATMSASAMPPVAIGGVGGSGTRLVAGLLGNLGIHLGDDLNGSLDTLWFTLLFKRQEILQVDDREFDLLVRALVAGLRGGDPLTSDAASHLAGLAEFDRPQHPASWLQARVATLLDAAACPERDGRWGWKEPNTHVVIGRLWQRLPTLRYIHVVRHGIDMAYSGNQNQLQFWGKRELGEAGPVTPAHALAYWCRIHRSMQELHAENAHRMYWLDYDALCTDPEQELRELCTFLGYGPERGASLDVGIKPLVHRHASRSLDGFAADDVEFVRSLGYAIERMAPIKE